MNEMESVQERAGGQDAGGSRVSYAFGAVGGSVDHAPCVFNLQVTDGTPRRVLAIAFILILVISAFAGVVLALEDARVSPGGIVCSVIVIVLVLAAGILLWAGVEGRAVGRALADSGVTNVLQLVLVFCKHQSLTGEPYTRQLVRELVRRGWWGTSIRLWKLKRPEEIRPFDFPFEPRVVDESDASLCELVAASEAESVEDGKATSLRQRTAECSPLLRRVRRNIKMGGGWLVLFSFLPGIFWVILDSIRNGRLTGMAMLLGVAVILSLLMHRGHANTPLGSKQLLMVPGGLLLRKPKRGGVSSELHLFRRDASILCALPLYGKSWKLLLKDEGRSDVFYITETELNAALRAWFSPIEPPPVERLSDFA